MSALISGSMAYDTIMVFHDKFRHHILPEKVHILNVSFLVPGLRREFGGCAGNIAYNLKQLGEEPLILATVGHDFEPYAQWLAQSVVSARYIEVLDDHYTGQAYITTDEDDNQITAFHPGAMNYAHHLHVPADADIDIAIIAPNGKEGMQQHARECREQGIPFIFDPGQGLPMFSGDELLEFVELADWLIVNDYESELLADKTGQSIEQLAQKVKALIVTLGGNGSKIYTDGECLTIPAARPQAINDPTGCGDAYRAGVLYGLINGFAWDVTGRIAAILGAIKIEHHGTQNHGFDLDQVRARYLENFGGSF
ncbi:MAG: carbohydrate kinase family protein [Methylococcales bacterium]|nr:carbohydrate kinase family protein [Methylococcales bacterium]